MSKVKKLLYSIFAFFAFLNMAATVNASHIPLCTEETKGKIITEAHELHDSGNGLRSCPSETGCYEEIPGIATPIVCYEKKAEAESAATAPTQATEPAPKPNEPTSATGAECVTEPKTLPIRTDKMTFQATGLTPNQMHQIKFNRSDPPLTNFKVIIGTKLDNRRVRSDSNGTIKIELAPVDAISTFGASVTGGELDMYEIPGAGNKFICSDGFVIEKNITNLPPDTKWYRCEVNGNACVESVDYLGKPNPLNATPDKEACDKQCIGDVKIIPALGGGVPCDPKSGKAVDRPSKQKIAQQLSLGTIAFDAAKNTLVNPGNPSRAVTGTLDDLGKKVDEEYKNQLNALPKGIMTAIGCVPTEPKPFVEGMLKFVSFAAGGIALLLMILGALQMITAEGNPENIKNAQEKFYSAIIGLLFIIFSVLLLQVIGVDILGLPQFVK